MATRNVKDFDTANSINFNTNSVLSVQNGELKRLNGSSINITGNINITGSVNTSQLTVNSTPVALSGQFINSILVCTHASSTISQNQTYYIAQVFDAGASTSRDKCFRVPVSGKVKAYNINTYNAGGTKPTTTYNVNYGIHDVVANTSLGNFAALSNTTIFNVTFTGLAGTVNPPIQLQPDKFYAVSIAVGGMGATNATATRNTINLYLE